MCLTDGSFLWPHKETLWVNVLFCVFLMAKQNLGEVLFFFFFGGLQALSEHQGPFLPSWGQGQEVPPPPHLSDSQPFVPDQTDAALAKPKHKGRSNPTRVI